MRSREAIEKLPVKYATSKKDDDRGHEIESKVTVKPRTEHLQKTESLKAMKLFRTT